MTRFTVGRPAGMSIANVGDVAKEKELKRYDANDDNVLGVDEAARYYADQTGGYRPSSFDEVFKLVGGRQHEMRAVHQEPYMLGWFASDWKGDFNVPELGAGNIRTGRNKQQTHSSTTGGPEHRVDAYNIVVDCNLMDRKLLEEHLASATLVIGPRGFNQEDGSGLGEAVVVPLDLSTQDGYQTYSRGGGSSYVPDKKHLGVSLSTEDLRALAGESGGLSFYIKLETDQGTRYLNRDGRAFSNFDIDAAELRPDDV